MQITSLEQYISEVKKVALSDIEMAFPKVYFRGEAKKNWTTQASLFRGDVGKEGNLIDSALIQYPKAFENCSNAISRLILMQHYGLPTRLYDVTANPLVVLFLHVIQNIIGMAKCCLQSLVLKFIQTVL
jgi:hypothetical protein